MSNSVCLFVCVYVHKYQPSYMQRDGSINKTKLYMFDDKHDDCVGAKEIDDFVTDPARPSSLTKKVK